MECLASVQLDSGNHLSLLKLRNETITPSLRASRGKLGRGKFYRVTFEEIEGLTPWPVSL
jgi:hypothetical protein